MTGLRLVEPNDCKTLRFPLWERKKLVIVLAGISEFPLENHLSFGPGVRISRKLNMHELLPLRVESRHVDFAFPPSTRTLAELDVRADKVALVLIPLCPQLFEKIQCLPSE